MVHFDELELKCASMDIAKMLAVNSADVTLWHTCGCLVTHSLCIAILNNTGLYKLHFECVHRISVTFESSMEYIS